MAEVKMRRSAAVAGKQTEAQDATLTATRRIGPIREAINRVENLRGMALGIAGVMEIEFDRVFGAVPEDPQPGTDNSDLSDAEVAQLHIHITSLENAMRRLYQQAQRAQDL